MLSRVIICVVSRFAFVIITPTPFFILDDSMRDRIPSDGSLRRETRASMLQGLKDIYLEESRSTEAQVAAVVIQPQPPSALDKYLRLLQEDCEVHRALKIEPFLE